MMHAGGARVVCCLLVWAVAPCAAPAEKAALEAELGMRASGLVDTDPLRSNDLGFLGRSTAPCSAPTTSTAS